MRLKGYTIQKILAESPSMTVAVAVQQSLDRKVLLKILSGDFSRQQDIMDQFESEARVLARLADPNIVTIYEFHRQGKNPAIVLEYFSGRDLREIRRERGAFKVPDLIPVMEQSLRALEHSHSAGILHRDLKPENILINSRGLVKLTDFGLAGLENAAGGREIVAGTPGYFAPELILGAAPSRQTDIYALGMTFYELVTGTNPLKADTLNASWNLAVARVPEKITAVDPRVPAGPARIIERMIAKSPEERYRDCGRILEDLAALGGTSVDSPAMAESTTTAGTRPPGIRSTNRRRFTYFLTAAAVLVLGVTVIWKSWIADPGVDPAAEAGLQGEIVPSPNPENPANAVASPGSMTRSEHSPPEVPAGPGENALEPTGRPAAGTASGRFEDPREAAPAATLMVMANPWAEVFLNDRSVGITPLEAPVSVPPGKHVIRFRNPAFPDYSRPLVISSPTADTLVFRWQEVCGHLELSVNPWARVYIDGKFMDVTPLAGGFPLLAGEHQVLLENPEYQIWQKHITLAAGDTLRLRVQLR